MNIEQFLAKYMKLSGERPVAPFDRIVVLNPKTGTEHNIVGLHYIPTALTGQGESKLVIELE